MAKHRISDRAKGLVGETNPQKIKDTYDKIKANEQVASDVVKRGK